MGELQQEEIREISPPGDGTWATEMCLWHLPSSPMMSLILSCPRVPHVSTLPSSPSCFSPYRWVFLYEKGYQTQDSIVSSVSVKLKGLTMTNESTLGPHIWDVVDYVFPPQVRGQEGLGTAVTPTRNFPMHHVGFPWCKAGGSHNNPLPT